MDPLSITASIVTLLGVAATAGKGLKHIHSLSGAPQEFQVWINEIFDIQFILSELHDTIEGRHQWNQSRLSPMFTLCPSLNRSIEVMEDINRHVTDHIITSGSSGRLIKVRRTSWVKNKRKLAAMTAELQGLRNTFSTLLALLHCRDLSSIEMQLQQLSMGMTAVATCQHDSQSLTQQDNAGNDSLSTGLHSQGLTDGHQNDRSEQERQIESPLEFSNATRRQSATDSSLHLAHRINHIPASLGYSYVTPASNERLVRPTLEHISSCPPWCGCLCHTKRKWSTPEWLESYIGRCLVAYSGNWIASQYCSESSCSRQSTNKFGLTYTFPFWMTPRMLQFQMDFHPLNGVSLWIKTPRIVSVNSEIFTFARYGDIEGMVQLFREGKASPFDVKAYDGLSPLQVAIDYGQVKACEFLIGKGANLHHVDNSKETPLDDAWNWILRGGVRLSDEDRVRRLFDNDDYLDSFKHTILHKIVLGISSGDIEAELQKDKSQIDATDSTSRTALYWAIAREDLASARLLLKYGADPDMGNPLSIALDPWHSTPDCMKLLLDADVDIDQGDALNRTALHLIARTHNDRNFIDPVIAKQPDLNKRDIYNQTPLHEACFRTHDNIAKALVEAGADVNAVGMHNYTPLQAAICNRFANDGLSDSPGLDSASVRLGRIVGYLLAAGPDWDVCVMSGNGMLHFLAQFADIQMIKLFQETNLRGWDSQAKNERKETAYQVLAKRQNVNTRLLRAFGELCELIEEGSPVIHDTENLMLLGIVEEGLFVDALEYLSARTA